MAQKFNFAIKLCFFDLLPIIHVAKTIVELYHANIGPKSLNPSSNDDLFYLAREPNP